MQTKTPWKGRIFPKIQPTTIWRIELTYLPTLIASKLIPSILELPTPATTTAAVVKLHDINPKDIQGGEHNDAQLEV